MGSETTIPKTPDLAWDNRADIDIVNTTTSSIPWKTPNAKSRHESRYPLTPISPSNKVRRPFEKGIERGSRQRDNILKNEMMEEEAGAAGHDGHGKPATASLEQTSENFEEEDAKVKANDVEVIEVKEDDAEEQLEEQEEEEEEEDSDSTDWMDERLDRRNNRQVRKKKRRVVYYPEMRRKRQNAMKEKRAFGDPDGKKS